MILEFLSLADSQFQELIIMLVVVVLALKPMCLLQESYLVLGLEREHKPSTAGPKGFGGHYHLVELEESRKLIEN